MDPISLSLSAIGFGLQIAGGLGQASSAKEIARVSNDKAQHEMQINTMKQQQIRLEAQRMQMQDTRNMQRSRAMALNAATSQGAQYGSGLQGGLAEVTNQGLFNIQGVRQALQTSEAVYGQNQFITQDNAKIASLQGDASTSQGISSVGGSIMKSAPGLGQLLKGFG